MSHKREKRERGVVVFIKLGSKISWGDGWEVLTRTEGSIKMQILQAFGLNLSRLQRRLWIRNYKIISCLNGRETWCLPLMWQHGL